MARWGWTAQRTALATAVGLVVAMAGWSGLSGAAGGTTTTSFLATLHSTTQIASTVPANGDVNPYGVAVVPSSLGRLVAGSTLVSNFNDKANVQGTGKTIVQVSSSGSVALFSHVTKLSSGASCPGGIGLTTALGILPGGWVVVGSLPTTSGGALSKLDPVGCLLVLNDNGTVVETLTNKHIVAPWDLALTSSSTSASVFISNALGGVTKSHNGTPEAGNGTVVRLDLALSPTAPPKLTSATVVGSKFPWRANKTALVLAPTGLAIAQNNTLFVDDTLTNSVSAIPDATTRTSAMTASSTTIDTGGGLNAPLGMLLAPNGDLVVVNGGNGRATELTEHGMQVATKTLVKQGAGDLFGIAMNPSGSGMLFTNDGTNALDIAQP
jgi:hypothetical protein